MLLAVDVGNTNVVCALYESMGQGGAVQSGFWRLETDAAKTADDYYVALTDILDSSADKVQDAIVASVVPAVTPALEQALARLSGKAPLVVGTPGVDLGMEVRIANPEQAGADRLVNAIGAQVDYDLPAIVLDFGTATTLDLVAADGAYEGGIIAPGVNLSLDALEMAAAQLPRLQVRPWASDLPVLGKDTVSAMESGVFWGYVGLIDGLLARLRAEYGNDLHAIATGGLAALFADHVKSITAVDPDLTVKGLVEIYKRNRGGLGDGSDTDDIA